MENHLLANLDKLHTTQMGADRIRRNLHINVADTVKYCYDIITEQNAHIERKGKNWYITGQGCIITVNANSFTIITAHKIAHKL